MPPKKQESKDSGAKRKADQKAGTEGAMKKAKVAEGAEGNKPEVKKATGKKARRANARKFGVSLKKYVRCSSEAAAAMVSLLSLSF